MNKGAFQTSREIFENPIWEDVPKFRIFFYIYGNAVFSDKGITKGSVHIGRGQFLRSYRNLREDLQYIENRSIKKYSLSMISRKIEQLVKEERLKIEDTELGTLFTVVNYSSYQGLSNYKKNNENAERTVKEQLENGDGTEQEQNENNNKNVEEGTKNVKNVLKDTTTTPEEKEDAIAFYQNNFGMAAPFVAESIMHWINDMSEEMVLEAMKRAVSQNKKSWRYTERILKGWHESNVSTIKQAKAEEVEFVNKQSQNKPFYQKNNQSNDIVPDWYKNRDHEKKPTENQNNGVVTEEQKRVAEMMRRYAE